MANNETIPEREEAMVSMGEAAVGLLHQMTHGDETVEVITDSGPVPSVKKWQADNAAIFRDSAILAQSAASSALIQAGVYTDEVAGRAAVLDGQAFKIQGSGAVAAYEYRRINAGASVLIGTYPSASALAGAKLSSGELMGQYTVAGQDFNGSVFVRNASGKILGFSIPAGSSGATTYLTYYLSLPAAAMAKLVGSTLRLCFEAEVSEGFLGEKGFSAIGVQVARPTGTVNLGTISKSEQVGTRFRREVLYTVTAQDTNVGICLQIPVSSVVRQVNHQVKATSLSYRIEVSASGTLSESDLMLEDRVAASPAVQSKRFGIGAVFDSMTSSPQMFQGATTRVVNGRVLGLNIPQGQSGDVSLIEYKVGFETVDQPLLAGRTLRVTFSFDTSAGFSKKVNPLLKTYYGSTYRLVAATVVRNEQVSSTRRVMEITAPLIGDEKTVAPYLQVSGADVVAQDCWIELTDLVIEIAASPVLGANVMDENLRLAQARSRRTAVAEATAGVANSPAILSRRFGIGPVFEALKTAPQVFNGATTRTVNGKVLGINVPQGSSGNTSLVEYITAFEVADQPFLAGRTLRVVYGFDTSAGFALGVLPKAKTYYSGGYRLLAGTIVRNEQVSSTRRVMEITMVLTGDETGVSAWIQFGATVAAQDSWLVLTDMLLEIVASPAGVGSLADENLALAQARLKRAAVTEALASLPSSSEYGAVKTVRADGSGDFTAPGAANTSITDAASGKTYKVALGPGNYASESNWRLKNYIDLVGGDRSQVKISYELPDNVDPAQIPNTQTLWMNETGRLKGLTITARNMRYPVHSDSSGANKDRTQEIEDCWIEHLGNQGARDWQSANGGNPSAVWGSTHAWGCGTSSGMQIKARRSTFRSPTSAFYFHTREYFDKPCYVLLDQCACISTNESGNAIVVQPLGSRKADVLEVKGCGLVGDISYNAWPWIPTALADQPASHAEVRIVGSANSPSVFRITEFGRALRIESATTAGVSTVAVSGSAVAVLFGEVTEKPGSGGIPGYVYGWADVSGVAVGLNANVLITSLGRRLGNCLAVPLELRISVNGAAEVLVTFNQDYTAFTNAQILALINTALAGTASASEYNVGGRYRPSFLDEEMLLRNSSADGILMGMALAYDKTQKQVRAMTSADGAHLFAGVAWEDIYPGGWGRVKTRGYLAYGDLLGSFGALEMGTPIYVDAAKPGRLATVPSGAVVMRAIRSDAVKVRD